MYNNASPLGPI